MIPLTVGNLAFDLDVPPALEAVARRKYAGFIRDASDEIAARPLRLRVTRSASLPEIEPMRLPRLHLERIDADRVAMIGDSPGELDLANGYGEVDGRYPLAGLDALLRLALSLISPRNGWLLFHGAALAVRDERWAVLLGRSGAGKSTAARAFDAYCDELVLARPHAAGCEVASTPYWNGRAGRAPCAALVCLDKGGTIGIRPLRGGDIARSLAPHLVRHIALPDGEEATMTLLCEVARNTAVFEIGCPTGPRYLPFLEQALATIGCAPLASSQEAAGAVHHG